MKYQSLWLSIGSVCLTLILLSACDNSIISTETNIEPAQQTAYTISPTPSPLLDQNPLIISEVMAGEADYIELFNTSSQAINLKGHYLIYRLGTDNLDQPIFQLVHGSGTLLIYFS